MPAPDDSAGSRPGPFRTCVGCRHTLPQSELVRCVLGPQGATIGRSAPGRGAWVCSVECVRSSIDRRGFDRAWRQRVAPGALERLVTEVAEALGPGAGRTATHAAR